MKITRNPVYAAILTTVSLQEFIPLQDEIMKTDNTVGKKSDIGTFLTTECNRTQGALCYQKLSSFNIKSPKGYPHIFLLRSVTPFRSQANKNLHLSRIQFQILSISFIFLSSEVVSIIFCNTLNKMHFKMKVKYSTQYNVSFTNSNL